MKNSNESISRPLEMVYQETCQNLHIKTHFHNCYEIIYVQAGNAEFTINHKTYALEGNTLVFISNLESHELKVTGCPYKRYFMLLTPEFIQPVVSEPILASIFKHRPEHFRHSIKIRDAHNACILSMIENMYSEYSRQEPLWESALSSALLQLLVFLYRNYADSFPMTSLNPSMRTVLEIQKYIEENYTEEISLSEISRRHYTDMYYLSHLFKKVTGFTFKEYLILQRISKAKELLSYTAQGVTEIAVRSGFNNVNHFIRIFKKYEKITPYQYKKSSGTTKS